MRIIAYFGPHCFIFICGWIFRNSGRVKRFYERTFFIRVKYSFEGRRALLWCFSVGLSSLLGI